MDAAVVVCDRSDRAVAVLCCDRVVRNARGRGCCVVVCAKVPADAMAVRLLLLMVATVLLDVCAAGYVSVAPVATAEAAVLSVVCQRVDRCCADAVHCLLLSVDYCC